MSSCLSCGRIRKNPRAVPSRSFYLRMVVFSYNLRQGSSRFACSVLEENKTVHSLCKSQKCILIAANCVNNIIGDNSAIASGIASAKILGKMLIVYTNAIHQQNKWLLRVAFEVPLPDTETAIPCINHLRKEASLHFAESPRCNSSMRHGSPCSIRFERSLLLNWKSQYETDQIDCCCLHYLRQDLPKCGFQSLLHTAETGYCHEIRPYPGTGTGNKKPDKLIGISSSFRMKICALITRSNRGVTV